MRHAYTVAVAACNRVAGVYMVVWIDELTICGHELYRNALNILLARIREKYTNVCSIACALFAVCIMHS